MRRSDVGGTVVFFALLLSILNALGDNTHWALSLIALALAMLAHVRIDRSEGR